MEATSTEETRSRIVEQLQTVTDLPTLPTVFLKVMRMMRNPDTPIHEISQVVESDPAISMKILKLVNSSFYGLSRTVDSVHQSIVLLGSNTLRNIIISVSIFKAIGSEKQGTGFNRTAFWKHSIACGLIARFMEKRLELATSEEAFIGGVIHDIGKVVLDKYFSEELSEVLRVTRRSQIPFHQAEKSVLGTTHTEIGAYLADNWKLPAKFVEVIARHHRFDPDSEHAEINAMIHLSDALAYRYGVGSGGHPSIPTVDPAALEKLGITENTISGWDEELRREIEKSKELLSVISA